MRLIHRFDPITGPVLVTLLIVTQMLSPLIHGHGGYAEPVRGFHMPGFENLSRTSGRIDIGSNNGFQYAGLELIISVASGIEPKLPDDSDFGDHELFFALIHSVFADALRYPTVAYSQAPASILPIPGSWTHRPSRAPPQF